MVVKLYWSELEWEMGVRWWVRYGRDGGEEVSNVCRTHTRCGEWWERSVGKWKSGLEQW